MRGLVIGGSGLVGGAILRALGSDGVGTYLARRRPGLVQLDARDTAAVRELIARIDPDVIYLPAAQPDVEWCEQHPDEARELNLAPVRSTLAAGGGRPIVAYSTDYVFDGRSGPYIETDPTGPLSEYGRIKLELEERLLATGRNAAIRTTGVFGYEPPPGKNFVLRLIRSLRDGQTVRVPSDQVANPTYAPDLAAASVAIAERGAPGLWHVAGPDLVARTELAVRVARAFGLRAELIVGVPTAELGQAAPRPLRSGLLSPRYEAAFGVAGRPLDEALADLRLEIDGATAATT